MRIDRIRLRNFKCYGEAELSLDRGVTVVHGVNGSGKSTLLEAVFFALYGSKALDERTLDDIITIGESETEVELQFTHDGTAYTIDRKLKLRGDRAATTKCVLDTPTETIEGARDVGREVTRLLRMDADAFVNCAYVRQGEVNKLIHASPSDRQDMIDDLLQLGTLEEYRDRASEARLGVKTVLDGQREVRENVQTRVEEKEAKALHDRLNGLRSKRKETIAEIENFETQREKAESTLETANDVLERHEETREEIDELADAIETLTSKITETERDREAATDELREIETTREELADEREERLADLAVPGTDTEAIESRIETLESRDETLRDELQEIQLSIKTKTTTIEGLRETAADREEAAEQAREEAAELDTTIESDEETIDDWAAKLDRIDEQIETERGAFEDAPVAFGDAADHLDSLETERDELTDAIGDVTADIRAAESAIEEGEALREAGKCPECGQPVEDSPHVDVLDERRAELDELTERKAELTADRDAVDDRIDEAERLRERERTVNQLDSDRDKFEQLLTEKRETVAQRREQRTQLREQADEYEAEAASKREEAAELETAVESARSEIGELNAERGDIKETVAQLERIVEIDDERSTLADEAHRLRERRSDWQQLNDERREALSEKRDRKRDLEAEFDDRRIEEARQNKRDAETYIEQVEAKLDELEESREQLGSDIGAVENEIDELETLRDELEQIETRCERLESLYEEAETLQATYGELRSELRQHNVETLERLLNETFELIYQNDSYAGIDLDGDYQLTVYQKDGEALEPEQLSGGERALFNLSLRCAIYRLLAEGVEGTAPMPPLILDEPTVFLDSGHVTQLVSLIESMRDLGVEQIVVVSHDDNLIDANDAVVHVTKDSTSNRSRLDREEAIDPALLTSD